MYGDLKYISKCIAAVHFKNGKNFIWLWHTCPVILDILVYKYFLEKRDAANRDKLSFYKLYSEQKEGDKQFISFSETKDIFRYEFKLNTTEL